MKRRHRYGAVAIWCVGLFLLATVLSAQKFTNRSRTGVPQDWTQRHIIFSREGLLQHPDLINLEPRVFHQAMQRWQRPNSDIFHGADAAQTPSIGVANQRDWSVNLRGRISPNMFPAKYSFDPAAAPSCANDYVVFGTTAPGVTGGSANLVAFNNLYAGPGGLCGADPNVLFGYNITTATGGKIVTSPVISVDGKKIAFVESGGPTAVFHVLTWTAGQGGIGTAAAPTMTSVPFSAGNSTTSSPWVDYGGDIAYLGADDGKVYKITGVFKGTPTLAGAPWPVTVSANFHLTPPVLDKGRELLMVGSANGNLYRINTATGALTTLVIGRGTNHGILAPPIVDITNGTTFVVSSNDSTTGVLVEVDTATLTQLAKARIGQASASGTAVNLYQPAFSDSYYNNPSTGVVRLCGTGAADTTPWQYAFGFTGRTMQTTASFSQQLVTSTLARCTGWTEFFNPNIGVGGTDFFFFGLTQDCTAPGTGATDGCVVARSSDTVLTKATLTGGPSGIVVDNYSTAGQASSIYMMAKNVNTAYKFTQNGLQ